MKFPIVIPDGTRLGGPDGMLYRVFAPPWWRLDRWLGWWWRTWSDGVRGKVRFTMAGGASVEMRVEAAPELLPLVPRSDAKRIAE